MADPVKDAFRAAKAGDAAAVREMVEREPALLQARDREGATLLHHAAWKGHAEVARLLIERGADVEAQSTNTHWGGTPLHAAAHANQRQVAEILLERGADARASSCNGRTPLDETTLHKANAVARLLRARGA